MKLSLTGLRAPYGTSFDVLRNCRPPTSSGWKVQNAARFSGSTADRARNASAVAHGLQTQPDNATGRASSSIARSSSSAEQRDAPSIGLAESLHELADSLGSETNTKLSISQQHELFQSVTAKLERLIDLQRQQLEQQEDGKEQDNSIRESVTNSSSTTIRVLKTEPKKEQGYPYHSASTHSKVVIRRDKGRQLQDPSDNADTGRPKYRQIAESTSNYSQRLEEDETPIQGDLNQHTVPRTLTRSPLFRFQDKFSSERSLKIRNRTTSDSRQAPQLSSTTKVEESIDRKRRDSHFQGHVQDGDKESVFPGVPERLFWTLPTTQQLDLEQRRTVLQLATHLNEVLIYAAAERNVEVKRSSNNRSKELLSPAEGYRMLMTSFPMTTNSPLSHMSILAAYIDLQARKFYLSEQDYDNLLKQLFDDHTLTYLQGNNYDIDDIVAWAWILSTQSDYDAITRLLLWTNRPMPSPRVPRFVLHILLERNITDSKVVQLLTSHLSDRVKNRIDKSWETLYKNFISATTHTAKNSAFEDTIETANYRALDPWTDSRRLSVAIFRLLKMAVWSIPALLPTLASLLCEHMRVTQANASTRDERSSSKGIAYLTHRFNQALAELASKTPEPYTSVPYQERAQFIIVRHMSEFRPPLALGRKAYQAVVSIQLRHRKTVKERMWTELKSRGWPPYREDKSGLDATKKDEVYGISRAQQGLLNLKEAGFADADWEHSSSVLSGWDVDRSPTIQTRRIFLPPTETSMGKEDQKDEHPTLWEARVLSTRTIQEAWAVFLNYVEEDTPPTPNVFLAMFEKISQERTRKIQTDSRRGLASSIVLAGDMPETWPLSPNPRDQVYIPSPPPTFDQFYQRYLDHFSTLDHRALSFLLSNAESLEHGFKYLEASDLSSEERDILLRQKTTTKKGSLRLPSAVFTAYIRMLSEFATEPLPNNDQVSALQHAIHLVETAQPFYRGPWLYLLQALEMVLRKPMKKVLWQRNWNVMTDIIRKMQLAGVRHDSDTFYTICTLLSHLLHIASGGGDNGYHGFYVRMGPSSDVLIRTASLVKNVFKDLVSFDLKNVVDPQKAANLSFLPLSRPDFAGVEAVSNSSTSDPLPQLLYVPSPAALHRFIRLLGTLQDTQGVVELIKWMSFFDPELQAKCNELAGGPRHFRWILVAARITSETTSTPFMTGMALRHLDNAGSEHAIQLRAIVEEKESWGGWPDDEEVTEYLEYGISSSIDSAP